MKKYILCLLSVGICIQSAEAVEVGCLIRYTNDGGFITIFKNNFPDKAQYVVDSAASAYKKTLPQILQTVRSYQKSGKCEKGDIPIENDEWGAFKGVTFEGYPSTSLEPIPNKEKAAEEPVKAKVAPQEPAKKVYSDCKMEESTDVVEPILVHLQVQKDDGKTEIETRRYASQREAIDSIRKKQSEKRCPVGDIRFEKKNKDVAIFDGAGTTYDPKKVEHPPEYDCNKPILTTINQTWTINDTARDQVSFDIPKNKSALSIYMEWSWTEVAFQELGERKGCEFKLKPFTEDYKRVYYSSHPLVKSGEKEARSLKIVSASYIKAVEKSKKRKNGDSEPKQDIIFNVDDSDPTFESIRCHGVATMGDLKSVLSNQDRSGLSTWRMSGIECPIKSIDDAFVPDSPKNSGRRGLKQLPSDGKDTWSSEPKPEKAGQI